MDNQRSLSNYFDNIVLKRGVDNQQAIILSPIVIFPWFHRLLAQRLFLLQKLTGCDLKLEYNLCDCKQFEYQWVIEIISWLPKPTSNFYLINTTMNTFMDENGSNAWLVSAYVRNIVWGRKTISICRCVSKNYWGISWHQTEWNSLIQSDDHYPDEEGAYLGYRWAYLSDFSKL